ncbi:methyltransferase domain-containing protein [Catalinimonas alkaloidigena]|uniref:methyltransferase domain-containing protein n=1 Tax=Catalinimonas alkaloidigena TaxID=1075417 RepID=UPI003977B06D
MHPKYDFGGGTAALTRLIKRTYPQTAVFGVDVAPRILQSARSKARSCHILIHLHTFDRTHLLYQDTFLDRVAPDLLSPGCASERSDPEGNLPGIPSGRGSSLG